jgi:hypothetical protein
MTDDEIDALRRRLAHLPEVGVAAELADRVGRGALEAFDGGAPPAASWARRLAMPVALAGTAGAFLSWAVSFSAALYP